MLTPPQQDAEFLRKFEKTNRSLLDMGWLQVQLMPNYLVDEVEHILDLHQTTNSSQTSTKPLSEINEIMLQHVFSPTVRAYILFRMRFQPSCQLVSHHVEAATHHYYNNDFFSCVLSMLPATEGMLLNRMGWSAKSATPKPSFRKAIDSITNSAPRSSFFPKRFELHRDALTAFMKQWIFADRNKIESDVSYLNRHYALHCMEDGCYYTAHDCHRLFTLVDVYLDFLSYENGIGSYAFIPIDDPFIEKRIQHYVSVILGDKPLSAIREQSLSLMKAHSGFTAETNPPDYEKILAKGDELRRKMRRLSRN